MRYTEYAFEVPEEKIVRVLIDTDAKNEADDQFAIVQALLSPKLENKGFIAAHFGTRLPDSMERSYAELEKIFDLMGFEKEGMIFRGAERAIQDKAVPQVSEGARKIVEEAMKNGVMADFLRLKGPL